MQYHKKLLMLSALALLGLAGCGGDSDHGPPPSFTTQILSDPVFDGDIQELAPSTYVVTQGMTPDVQSVFAGIDPRSQTEYRTFLDFPLGGSGGIPANAAIESAFLNFFVNSLQPASASLPIRIELVAFQPPTLIGSDYDRAAQPALAYVQASPDFVLSDVGTDVSIDVTDLMVLAQQHGLVDFQVRIMEDLGPAIIGLLEINDSTAGDRASRAPQLTVTYF
jgi:hypothetical protein